MVAQRNLLDLAKQMNDALLLGERLDAVLGAEKVGDQYSFEQGAENLFHHLGSARWRQHIVGQGCIRETPDPSRAARDTPAALICVEQCGKPRSFPQPFINGDKDFGQPLPIQRRAAGGDLKLAEGAEPGADVSGRHAQRIMKEGRKKRKIQSQSGLVQCLRFPIWISSPLRL